MLDHGHQLHAAGPVVLLNPTVVKAVPRRHEQRGHWRSAGVPSLHRNGGWPSSLLRPSAPSFLDLLHFFTRQITNSRFGREGVRGSHVRFSGARIFRSRYIRKFWTLVFIDPWEDAEKTRIGCTLCREIGRVRDQRRPQTSFLPKAQFPNPISPSHRRRVRRRRLKTEHNAPAPRMFPTTRRKRRAEEPSSIRLWRWRRRRTGARQHGCGRRAGD